MFIFEGDILVLHHPTTISPKYQAMGEWVGEGLVSVCGRFCIELQLCVVRLASNCFIVYNSNYIFRSHFLP